MTRGCRAPILPRAVRHGSCVGGKPVARVTVEDCLDQCENRFALVILATKRARAIMNGDTPLVDTKNKEAVTALREIAAGRIVFDRPIQDLLKDGIR